MEIGSRLKEARETKNISLEQLQESTKIQKRYLAAIEQGDLHILPGKFYARAFIKEYALAVGLDPQELLTEYQDEASTSEEDEEEKVQYSRIQRTKRPNNSGKGPASFSFIPTVIVILLVIGIFFVGWTLYQKATTNDEPDVIEDGESDEIIRNKDEKPDTTDNEEDNDDEENESDKDDEADDDDISFSVADEESGNPPEPTIDVNDAGENVKVLLEASGDQEVYVDVKGESDENLYTGTLQAGDKSEEIDISDEERVHFNVGNSQQLTIKVNDKEVEYPTPPTESIHQKLWLNINKESD